MTTRALLPAVLALLTATSGVAAAETTAPSASVSLSIDRMVFPDGLYRASFSIDGACVAPSDAVQVLESICDDPSAVDSAAGTVRMAKLGFDVFRHIEAGRTDASFAETGQGAVPEQLDRVLVRLHEAGDLRVEIAGSQQAGLDPRPIAGTASSGGKIEGRSVIWTVPAATPGTYEFSVQFAPGAPAGFTGTFVPEVEVTRAASSQRLLDHVGAPPPPMSPVAVTRTSTLVLAQHVAPAQGPPIGGTQAYVPVAGNLPTAFEASASLDGAGAYYASASGAVEAVSIGLLDEVAPGSLGVVDTLGIWNSRPWIPGADKIAVNPTFERDEEGKIIGFRHEVYTPLATDLVLPVPPGPLSGMFWDGDAAVAGSVASIGEVSADSQEQPASDTGVIAADWNGSAATSWSGLWANNVPGGEANQLNYAKYKRDVENAALGAAGYPGGYGPYAVAAITQASVPIVVRGGDIDNRGGSTIEGEPFTVRVPQGHTYAGAAIFTVWMAQTNYQFSLDGSPEGITITPKMGPGKFWLESTHDGYERDWANLHMVAVFSTEMGRDYEGLTDSALVVPPGAVGSVDFLDADGSLTTRRLGPGTWRATVAPEGLSVTRIAA